MPEAFIVDAVRTAVGKRNGGFAAEHPADMAAHVIKTVVGRHDVDPPRSMTSYSAVWTTSVPKRATSPAQRHSQPAFRSRCPVSPSTASAALPSRPYISPPRPS